MKRKKALRGRGKRGGKVAILRASMGARKSSTAARAWWRRLREAREWRLELKLWRQVPKKRVTLNLDADVLAWFRDMGPRYQWEINKALRKEMEREMGKLES